MLKTEFNSLMDQLKLAYGKAKYPEIRTGMFWLKLHKIPRQSLSRAINKLIACEQYPPMYDKIEALLKSEIDDFAIREKEDFLSRLSDCTRCTNSGVVFMMPENLKHWQSPTACQCTCDRGEYLYPRYRKIHEMSGYTLAKQWEQKKIDPPKQIGSMYKLF